MTAFSTTSRGMVAALLGMPRVTQTVTRICSSYVDGLPGVHYVRVVPHGATTGDAFRVSDVTRDRLEMGQSPEYLGLEPCEPDDEEQFE
jgi:hypothetical protein